MPGRSVIGGVEIVFRVGSSPLNKIGQKGDQALSGNPCAEQCNSGRRKAREINEEAFLKREGRGLSRYANWANPHSFSVISGVSGASQKKLGSTPNRSSTQFSNSGGVLAADLLLNLICCTSDS